MDENIIDALKSDPFTNYIQAYKDAIESYIEEEKSPNKTRTPSKSNKESFAKKKSKAKTELCPSCAVKEQNENTKTTSKELKKSSSLRSKSKIKEEEA